MDLKQIAEINKEIADKLRLNQSRIFQIDYLLEGYYKKHDWNLFSIFELAQDNHPELLYLIEDNYLLADRLEHIKRELKQEQMEVLDFFRIRLKFDKYIK